MEETSLRKRKGDEKSIQSSEPKTMNLQKEVRPSLGTGPSQVQSRWVYATKSSSPSTTHTALLIKQFLALTPPSLLPVNSAYSCEVNMRVLVCAG